MPFQERCSEVNEKFYALFGLLGPLAVYASIGVSLTLSPSFSWESNTLSDLGHSVNSEVASIFNLGLLLAGFFLMIYSLTVLKNHARYSSIFLLVSAFLVQLLAVFNEVYGGLHYILAFPHFVMLSITTIVYTIEKRSTVAFVTFLIVMFSWLFYALNIFETGIAVPETVSKLIVFWIMVSAIRIYFGKDTSRQ